jgi:regulator of cell morphogenesis and NO signaling
MPLTLEELAIHIPGAIAVFEEYDIDYYQKGARTLRSACREKGLAFREIDNRLSELNDRSHIFFPLTLADMSADRLIDHVNGRFHSNEEALLRLLHRLLFRNGYNASESLLLSEVEPLFSLFKEKLLEHCRKEDELLFPWMRKLVMLHKTRQLKKSTHIMSVIENPLRLLRREHSQIVDMLNGIKHVAKNFTIPESSSAPYLVLMEHFKAFEADFHMHLHIENNILFPKLTAMEKSLTKY